MTGRKPVIFLITILLTPVTLYTIDSRCCPVNSNICNHCENPNLIGVVKDVERVPAVSSRSPFFFAEPTPNRAHIMKNINYGYLNFDNHKSIRNLGDLMDMSSEEIGTIGKPTHLRPVKALIPWKMEEVSSFLGGPKVLPDVILIPEDPKIEEIPDVLTEKERKLGRFVVQDPPIITDTMERERRLTQETDDMRDPEFEEKYLMETPRGYDKPPSIVLNKIVRPSEPLTPVENLQDYYRPVLAGPIHFSDEDNDLSFAEDEIGEALPQYEEDIISKLYEPQYHKLTGNTPQQQLTQQAQKIPQEKFYTLYHQKSLAHDDIQSGEGSPKKPIPEVQEYLPTEDTLPPQGIAHQPAQEADPSLPQNMVYNYNQEPSLKQFETVPPSKSNVAELHPVQPAQQAPQGEIHSPYIQEIFTQDALHEYGPGFSTETAFQDQANPINGINQKEQLEKIVPKQENLASQIIDQPVPQRDISNPYHQEPSLVEVEPSIKQSEHQYISVQKNETVEPENCSPNKDASHSSAPQYQPVEQREVYDQEKSAQYEVASLNENASDDQKQVPKSQQYLALHEVSPLQSNIPLHQSTQDVAQIVPQTDIPMEKTETVEPENYKHTEVASQDNDERDKQLTKTQNESQQKDNYYQGYVPLEIADISAKDAHKQQIGVSQTELSQGTIEEMLHQYREDIPKPQKNTTVSQEYDHLHECQDEKYSEDSKECLSTTETPKCDIEYITEEYTLEKPMFSETLQRSDEYNFKWTTTNCVTTACPLEVQIVPSTPAISITRDNSLTKEHQEENKESQGKVEKRRKKKKKKKNVKENDNEEIDDQDEDKRKHVPNISSRFAESINNLLDGFLTVL